MNEHTLITIFITFGLCAFIEWATNLILNRLSLQNHMLVKINEVNIIYKNDSIKFGNLKRAIMSLNESLVNELDKCFFSTETYEYENSNNYIFNIMRPQLAADGKISYITDETNDR